MSALGSKLRSISGSGHKGIAYYCPGCEKVHIAWYEGSVAWEWNKDVDEPTVTPSMRVFQPANDLKGTPEVTLCHHFLSRGLLRFLYDCKHSLAGQTVPLPDWPYAKGEYGGIDDE